MNASHVHRAVRTRRGLLVVLTALATGGALVVAAPGAAAEDPDPTMARTFTRTVAPVPSFVAAAGGELSLTRQTISGMAAQKYGLTPGLTDAQAGAARDGFSSSFTYPTTGSGDAEVVATAVGVLAAGNTTPVSAAAPGCSRNVGGAASRVVVTSVLDFYLLTVSTPQESGFVPVGSWRLPAHGSERPLAATVLEPTCSFDASSAIAVTYPSGIDWFAYDGSGEDGWNPRPVDRELVPTVTWAPDRGAVVASAHVNSDASYLPVEVPDTGDSPDVGNATMLAAVAVSDGSVALHRLELTSLAPGGGSSFVSESGYDVAQLDDGPITGASLAYDNRGQGRISDASYALSVRSGGVNHVWFGIIGRNVSPPDRVIAQEGACAGSAIPQLAVATVEGLNGGPVTGVACTVRTGDVTTVQRWSDYTSDADDPSPPSFPTGLPSAVTMSLPDALSPARVFVTWPCVLLSAWGSEQRPVRRACRSDMATVVVGTPGSGAARLYQLSTLDGPDDVSVRDLAGAQPGARVAVDQLPLARTTLTVRNDSETAEAATTPPVPVVYMMPAPVIRGLTQVRAGAPVTFGRTAGSGGGSGASFGTSVGATLSATLGDPTLASLQLTASAERATNTTDTTDMTKVIGRAVNNNRNEAVVVYTVMPVWQWKGRVTRDSTGIATTNETRVLTQIARRDGTVKASIAAGSVARLATDFPVLFGRDGTYGPTLVSVFGAGVFGDPGPTVKGADPGAYPVLPDADVVSPPLQRDGRPFCDTPTGSTGVTSLNSGVPSPYTEPDVSEQGGSYVAGGPPATVEVGDGVSDELSATITSTQTQTYATDFSVNATAGVTLGGVGVSVSAGFTIGNQISVSTSNSQSFTAEIGHIVGAPETGLPAGVAAGINRVLKQTERYSWEPFMCRRTTSLPGNGQTSALVLGFATSGFRGLADVTTGAPKAVTGSVRQQGAPVVAARPVVQFDRSGTAAAYEVVVSKAGGAQAQPATVTSVLSPPASAASPTRQAVTLRAALAPGVYSWRPTAISYDGVRVPGTVRWFKVA